MLLGFNGAAVVYVHNSILVLAKLNREHIQLLLNLNSLAFYFFSTKKAM